MPKFKVFVLRRATLDINSILFWISERSHAGAFKWMQSLSNAIIKLENSPEIFPFADEAVLLGIEIRNLLFKTKSGRSYRLIYMIEDSGVVKVLRVRGPGQAPLDGDEIE